MVKNNLDHQSKLSPPTNLHPLDYIQEYCIVKLASYRQIGHTSASLDLSTYPDFPTLLYVAPTVQMATYTQTVFPRLGVTYVSIRQANHHFEDLSRFNLVVLDQSGFPLISKARWPYKSLLDDCARRAQAGPFVLLIMH